ncbi:MAG: hypothetical protein ACRDQ7_07075 [Haloechinothrix sp.]
MAFTPDGGGSPAPSGDMFDSEGSMGAEAMGAVRADTQQLIAAAKSGGFRISEQGVKPMRDAINRMMDRLEAHIDNSDWLTQPPELGSSPYARRVADHDVKGGESAVKSLLALRQVLVDCDEALTRAAGIYREADEGNQDTFRSGGGSFRAV